MAKKPIRYFVSYTRQNRKALELHQRLKVLLSISRAYTYAGWRDTDLLAGEDWDNTIRAEIDACDVAVLMVSPAFVSRPYIVQTELPRFRALGKVLIPVHLHRVDFGRYELHGLDKVQLYCHEHNGFKRTYAECRTALQREQFANGLFADIEARLQSCGM